MIDELVAKLVGKNGIVSKITVAVGAGFAGGVVGAGMVEIENDVGICGVPFEIGMIAAVCVDPAALLGYCKAFWIMVPSIDFNVYMIA